MTILPVQANNFPKNKNVFVKQKQHPAVNFSCTSDTVTFKGNIGNSKQNFSELSSDELVQIVKKSISDDKMLGWGGTANVYKIDGGDFCLKVPNSEIKKIADNEDLQNIRVLPMSELDKINHVEYRLSNDILVMKLLKGQNCFEYTGDKKLLSLPQASYEKLLKQICHAVEHNAQMDSAPKNIIYNEEDNSLTAIDFTLPSNGLNDPFSNMFATLRSVYIFTNDDDKKISKRLAYIVLNAALKEFEADCNPTMSLDKYSFSVVLNKIGCTTDTKDKPQFKFLQQCFENLVQLKSEELRGKDVSLEQLKNQKLAKAIIKQLFNDAKDNSLQFVSENF